ncbi:hypothetical protein OAS39_05540 [Pirellulales bacterium]|nr:hypothetical protein [Pirellulales bacterium]
MNRYKDGLRWQRFAPKKKESAKKGDGDRFREVSPVPLHITILDGLDQMLWPDHYVQATAGAKFTPGLNTAGIRHVMQKGTDRNHTALSSNCVVLSRSAARNADELRASSVRCNDPATGRMPRKVRQNAFTASFELDARLHLM